MISEESAPAWRCGTTIWAVPPPAGPDDAALTPVVFTVWSACEEAWFSIMVM